MGVYLITYISGAQSVGPPPWQPTGEGMGRRQREGRGSQDAGQRWPGWALLELLPQAARGRARRGAQTIQQGSTPGSQAEAGDRGATAGPLPGAGLL